MPDLPAEVWALIGILVTGFAAYIREKMKSESSPYEAMAARLQVVEDRAARVPHLVAHLNLLGMWAVEAAQWMQAANDAYTEQVGKDYFPPPPLPPPRWDRRAIDIGPPPGWPDRRDYDGTA